MAGHDFNRPYVDQAGFATFKARDQVTTDQFGPLVKAYELSNVEYALRYQRLHGVNNMNRPPSHGRIFSGYLVVRRLDTPSQYETWMPGHVFDDLYEPT
jgi:hypothetical protein